MTFDRKDIILHSSNFQFLHGVLDDLGVAAFLPAVLKDVGLPENTLVDPGATLDGDQVLALLRKMKWQAFRKNPVQNVMEHYSFSGFGMLALAVMSAKSLEEAVAIASKFGEKEMPCFGINLNNACEEPRLVVSLLMDFEEMDPAALEIAVCGLKRIGDQIANLGSDCTIHFAHSPWLDISRAEAEKSYSEFNGCPVIFESDFTGITAPKAFWQRVPTNSNPITYNNTLKLLQEEDERRQNTEETFSAHVDRMLTKALDSERHLSAEQLADKLHITVRTLGRKLAKEGTSFNTLLNEVRLNSAKKMLEKTNLAVNVIALRIGYKDGNAFSRAFKNLTGVTPSQWRESNR
jgi:AraC-like DNA-binding protein